MRKLSTKQKMLGFSGITLIFVMCFLQFIFGYSHLKTVSSNWIFDFQHDSYMQEFINHNINMHLSPSYNSTCSLASDKRGPHQRVIAYSLYGNFSLADVSNKYFEPLKNTISLIPRIYPGWIVRIYHNHTNHDFLKSLVGSHVDLCNVTEIIQNRKFGDLFAMTWRWFPLLDNMVDILISRDSDSLIIQREEDAVREWITSERTFHIMRDHPAHCIYGFIMGCCWGVKIYRSRPRITLAAENMFSVNHLHEYDFDQILLDRFIWPVAKNDVISHDSFCCEIFRFTQPFPKQRTDRVFVGARSMGPPLNEAEKLSDLDKCPLRCRPTAYATSDWEFC